LSAHRIHYFFKTVTGSFIPRSCRILLMVINMTAVMMVVQLMELAALTEPKAKGVVTIFPCI